MGIVRYNLHKKRKTGAKQAIFRKKRKNELGRPAANTKLAEDNRIKSIRVRGGNVKVRALRLNEGNFSWGCEGQARKTRILDVVYNATNQELTRTKALVKSAIVLVDATPFRAWYEKFYNEAITGKSTAVKAEDKLEEKEKTAFESRRKGHVVDDLLKSQFKTGKLMAIVRSKPGQVGRADGQILEGPELAFYLKKAQKK